MILITSTLAFTVCTILENRTNQTETRLELYNDPRPSTNQSTSLKSGLIFDRFVCFVRMYGRTPSPEIMNHFSSLCFGLCLGVDQKTRVINDPLGQIHSLASSKHCFRLKFVLFC